MYKFTEQTYGKKVDPSDNYMLVGDIGGTNSNFGVLRDINKELILMLSLHIKSKEIISFVDVINDLILTLKSKYNLQFSSICLGAAGVISVSRDRVKPTNLTFTIDAQDIIKATDLKRVILINDFEAVGYGIDSIDKENLVIINSGTHTPKANKAIIGAGTGLGKSFFAWSEHEKRHILFPSEGGHGDFCAQSQEDIDLVNFIRQSKQEFHQSPEKAISFEDILSGEGIGRIYSFLGKIKQYETTKSTNIIKNNDLHPDIIFKYWQDDPRCHDTYAWYSQFYARAAKNFVLDTLALGGLYIAGGIASKNETMFKLDVFMQEFTNCQKQKYLLQQIPITLITDYNISLYGAAKCLLSKNGIKI